MSTGRLALAAALAALGMSGMAAAAPCFLVIDRDDTVIYRDVVPPFDLSDAKSPERAALRQKSQHLLIAEFENCNPVGYISASTGGTTATVDDIVNQLQPAIATSISQMGGTTSTATTSGGTRPAAAAAKPAATPRPAAAAASASTRVKN